MTVRVLVFIAIGFLVVSRTLMAAGYEGFGVTVGGDKSAVVKVTTLADDGPGSLREALRQGGRRIVFAKSGTVKLKKTLRINKSKLTVDGINSVVTIMGAPVARAAVTVAAAGRSRSSR